MSNTEIPQTVIAMVLAAIALGCSFWSLWRLARRSSRCRAETMGCRCKLRAGHQGLHQGPPMLWGGDLPRDIPDDIPGWTPRVVDAQGKDVPLPGVWLTKPVRPPPGSPIQKPKSGEEE